MNRSGTLAVGWSWNQLDGRAVIWTDGALQVAAAHLGVRGALEVFAPFDVNDRGQLLVLAAEPGGVNRYFVLTPR